MKKGCCFIFLLICVLVACSANKEMRKRKAEDRRNVAAAYIGQKNFTEALRELLEAQKLYADDPYLQSDLGFVYIQKEKFDLAIRHFKKALELKPDFSSAKNNLGVAYLKNENWDAAILCFKELTQNLLYTTPQNPLANLGLAYYHKGDYSQAEAYYRRALKLYVEGLNKDGTYVRALHGLGLTYIAMGRGPEAVVTLEKAAEFAPRIPELFLGLGQAYTLVQDYDKALRAYNKVVELVPEHSLAKDAIKASENIKGK